jgi:hypothetical protein
MASLELLLVNTFIVGYLWFALTWDHDEKSVLKSFDRRIRPLVRWSGLWHSWDMFAPEPPLSHRRLVLEITSEDGHTRRWTFPSWQEEGVIRSWLRVRDQILEQELLAARWEALLRPGFVSHVVRHEPGPSRITRVVMIGERERLRPLGQTPLREPLEREVLYTWVECRDQQR